MTENSTSTPATILVTGLSGAGRVTALNALEDCGFHRVDNLPADLIPHLIENNPTSRPLALGLGSRKTSREYITLKKVLDNLPDEVDLSLLFLEASAETIARRYNQTRRVHPNPKGRSITNAVVAEQEMLSELREMSQVIIDTSRLSPYELRAEIIRQFNLGDAHDLQITVQSFSYKFGTPPNADMVIDCRFLRNPHWDENLRDLDGKTQRIQDYVKSDENYNIFYDNISEMLGYMNAAMKKEGRSYFNIAFGCTGGKHRSVTMAETIGKTLIDEGHDVVIEHRELQKVSTL